MGMVSSSQHSKDLALRDEKLEKLESKIKEVSEEHKNTEERLVQNCRSISDIQVNLSDCCKSVEETTKSVSEIQVSLTNCLKSVEERTKSISDIQVSVSDCCKSVEETNKRMTEILIQEQKKTREDRERHKEDMQLLIKGMTEILIEKQKEAREERNLNREDRERHKEDMELLIKSLKLGFPSTVDEWMARFPAKNLQSKISDKKIMKISKSVNPRKILEVGLILGLTDSDIQQIKIDYGNVAEQSYQIIIKWKHKMGQKATARHLLQNIFRAVKEDPTIIYVDQLYQALLEK